MNSKKSCGIALVVFFISLYSLFCIGHYGGDGYEDYLTAKSIVLNHSLAFNDNAGNIDEFGYMKKLGIEGAGGNSYSSRGGLVVPLILSIFFFVGHMTAFFFKNIPHDFITMFFVSFSNPVISAVNCLMIFIICLNLSFSTRISLAVALIYGLATMSPVYTRTAFAEPVLTLFLLISFYMILKYKHSAGPGFLFFTALALAVSVFTKSLALIFLPCFVFYAVWVISEKKKDTPSRLLDTAALLLPLAALLFLIGIFNYIVYGNIFQFGARQAQDVTSRVIKMPHFIKGLYYYLMSTGKGFFIFNLPVILSFIGLSRVPEKERKEAVLFLLISVFNLIFFAMSFRRGSLFAWGPRYLLPSVAFLAFPIGYFLENNKDLPAKLGAWALSVAGFFIMLPCMFVNQSKFYFFVKEKLNLSEYMINFMPDLSPILGAWKMFISRLFFIAKGVNMNFIYNPDYRLVSPISASMDGYNNFDFWFLKVLSIRPEYHTLVFGLISLLIMLVSLSLVCIIYNACFRLTVKG